MGGGAKKQNLFRLDVWMWTSYPLFCGILHQHFKPSFLIVILYFMLESRVVVSVLNRKVVTTGKFYIGMNKSSVKSQCIELKGCDYRKVWRRDGHASESVHWAERLWVLMWLQESSTLTLVYNISQHIELKGCDYRKVSHWHGYNIRLWSVTEVTVQCLVPFPSFFTLTRVLYC